jgi:hypothetical protein
VWPTASKHVRSTEPSAKETEHWLPFGVRFLVCRILLYIAPMACILESLTICCGTDFSFPALSETSYGS